MNALSAAASRDTQSMRYPPWRTRAVLPSTSTRSRCGISSMSTSTNDQPSRSRAMGSPTYSAVFSKGTASYQNIVIQSACSSSRSLSLRVQLAMRLPGMTVASAIAVVSKTSSLPVL